MSRKVISVLLTLMILTALLSGCGKHSLADANSLTSAEGAADAQATSFVHGASSLSYICVAEEGVFYIDGTGSGHFLCYYDYDADAHFVLCNAPECSHMNEECLLFSPTRSLLPDLPIMTVRSTCCRKARRIRCTSSSKCR